MYEIRSGLMIKIGKQHWFGSLFDAWTCLFPQKSLILCQIISINTNQFSIFFSTDKKKAVIASGKKHAGKFGCQLMPCDCTLWYDHVSINIQQQAQSLHLCQENKNLHCCVLPCWLNVRRKIFPLTRLCTRSALDRRETASGGNIEPADYDSVALVRCEWH